MNANKYKTKEKLDVMVGGVPKFANDTKANTKSKEYNMAVVSVKQMETQKQQDAAKQQLLMQALMMQQQQMDMEKMKQGIMDMLSSARQPLPVQPFGQSAGVYNGPQMLTPDMMQGQQGVAQDQSQPNPMMQ